MAEIRATTAELFSRTVNRLPHFPVSSLRPTQERTLTILLQGQDCLAILPTGAGKSLIYSIFPYLLMEMEPEMKYYCLVISPLKALIADQVKAFRDQGLSCVGLLPKEEMPDGDLEGFCQGEYNLVISSPEALLDDGELGMQYEHCLKKLNICLITYDEAHVIREW
ncbi:hypothetical protein CAPTEDRAFT_185956 [Capitella teleta]|uniref:DNA 3'-5' helicase n=1 Tax=Capitella teleta TaxID=283909 RepID=R7TJ49_CAPTE|nr:hypothetical protein CAPTEDRAFT_185956 [Capitella teleta]|eukprot:ELT93734.1 hypothetical protein CAPTEDRAFT_185956 [Capitella teleta]